MVGRSFLLAGSCFGSLQSPSDFPSFLRPSSILSSLSDIRSLQPVLHLNSQYISSRLQTLQNSRHTHPLCRLHPPAVLADSNPGPTFRRHCRLIQVSRQARFSSAEREATAFCRRAGISTTRKHYHRSILITRHPHSRIRSKSRSSGAVSFRILASSDIASAPGHRMDV